MSYDLWTVKCIASFNVSWALSSIVDGDGEDTVYQDAQNVTVDEKIAILDHEPNEQELLLIRARLCNYAQNLFDYFGTIEVSKTSQVEKPNYFTGYMLTDEERATSSINEVRSLVIHE